MRQYVANSAYFGVVISLVGYEIGLFVKRKLKKSFINPLLIAIILVMCALIAMGIDFEAYNNSARYLSWLLTPATVCLAVPLYEQLSLLRRHFRAVMTGIASGVLTSLCSILLLSKLFGLSHNLYVTLLPKSITTAIGMGISEELGGVPSITMASIFITGIFGNVVAELVLKLFRITHPIAKGVSLGTACHAIGTAKALELGQIEGAMSSLAIAVAGLMTVVLASVFAQFM